MCLQCFQARGQGFCLNLVIPKETLGVPISKPYIYNLQRFKPLVQLDIILLGLQYLPDNYRVSYLYCYFNLKYLPR